MSDLMYNEVPVIGKKYNFGDWKLYSIHDDKQIKGFFGEMRWLSNFWDSPCYYQGTLYPSSENAYQAAKVHIDDRLALLHCSAADSKKVWKTLRKIPYTKEQWDDKKYEVMATILFSKFLINKDLRRKLLDTGNKYLEESNHWHDNGWGFCVCEKCKNKEHKNMLGKLLMKIRDFWR